MALIECDECGAQVSDKAQACVKCGAPLHSAMAALGPAAGVVTIQQTGNKFKALQLIGFACIAIGVIARAGAGEYWGTALATLGVILFAAGRVLAWWKHG